MRMYSFNELSKMDESDLSRIYANLTHRLRNRRQGDSRSEIETELCYVYRELEVRRARKIAHLNYTAAKNNRQSA